MDFLTLDYFHVAVFGMNVGGVPWTGQRDPELKDGFRNVMLVCVAMLLLVLLCFVCPYVYAKISAWRSKKALKKNWTLNRRSFLKRTIRNVGQERRGYLRI